MDMRYGIKIIFAILFFVCGCTPPQTHIKTSASLKEDNLVKDVLRSPLSQQRRTIIQTAHSLRGTPYLAGGSSPKGFDCSGFVLHVYDRAGVSVPRRTDLQYINGRKISLSKTKPGDLVFFQTTSRKISHVGIYIKDGMFIHAPSSGNRVSYASMDNPYWQSRYRGSVSYLRK